MSQGTDQSLALFQTRENKIQYRFEITVNDVFTLQHLQTLQKREGKFANQIQTKTLIVVLFDQFVHVHSVCN